MKKIILIAFFISFIFNIAYPQSREEQKRMFENAKELFNLGKYGLAMQEFKPLTSVYNDNPYIEYASYYYAVAAYNNDDLNDSKYMFRQLLNNYPQWEMIDGVRLWLTKIAFKQKEYETGLNHFSQIKEEPIQKLGEQIVISALSQIEQYEKLYKLYQENPDNKTVAIALANKIQEQPLEKLDKGLLLNLISLFDLDEAKYNIKAIDKSEKKDTYQVAVLLPFMYDEIQQNRQNIINEFVLELYQGIMLAKTQLGDQGINIKLLSYDTERDSAKTARILAKPEMKHMDLIIGPLYPKPVKLVSQFSYDHQINMINPLSTNAQVIGNNPYSFLFFPTNKTMGTKTAEWLHNNTAYNEGIIFYGTAEKDSVLAYNFKKRFESDKRGKVVMSRQIKESNTKEIIQLLTRKTIIDTETDDTLNIDETNEPSQIELFKIRRDSIDFILVSSDNPSMAASTITALETRQDSITLIGKGSWLSSRVVSYESLERLNAYLIDPAFVDKSSEEYKTFKNQFTEKFNTLPSENACTGFELMFTIGQLMEQYGNHYQNEFSDNQLKPGHLYAGYALKNENDNQYFPIIEFDNLELKNVNTGK